MSRRSVQLCEPRQRASCRPRHSIIYLWIVQVGAHGILELVLNAPTAPAQDTPCRSSAFGPL